MLDDQGCSQDEPGIGNIAYVKDLQTETIVSTGYRCSVFGKYQHPLTGFGWVSMKYLARYEVIININHMHPPDRF
jgi:hypothetical protein